VNIRQLRELTLATFLREGNAPKTSRSEIFFAGNATPSPVNQQFSTFGINSNFRHPLEPHQLSKMASAADQSAASMSSSSASAIAAPIAAPSATMLSFES